jgi:hypothetical protein
MSLCDKIDLFFYVLISEYWWMIAVFCGIIMMLPIAVKIIKDHLNEINE